jgi:hypothetical protein
MKAIFINRPRTSSDAFCLPIDNNDWGLMGILDTDKERRTSVKHKLS